MRSLHHCFALLFDGSHAEASSRLYTKPSKAWIIQGNEPDAIERLQTALTEIEAWVQAGSGQIILSLSFEAATAFSVAQGLLLSNKSSHTPWLQALAFEQAQVFNRTQALAWLAQQGQGAVAHFTPAKSLVEPAQFIKQIGVIRELIAAGDSYQVNYTFPLQNELLGFNGDAALALAYHQLVSDLKIAYGALLALPQSSLLSCSPELFVEMSANQMTCRPMKGTAAIAETEAETEQRAALLAKDAKNRAENVMIVDLMRNDLSRLSEVKQVTVPRLFEIERYGTVLQMTSTVQAELSQQPSLVSLLNALFPCGSITGAPKRRTLQIIDELEPYARGAYCGALGFIEKHEDKLHASFNVPIRTLQTTAQPQVDALGIEHWPIQTSVGAGITYSSDAPAEWEESLLKARFLTRHTQAFELIETMRVEDGAVALFEQHLARLQTSAQAFNWPLPSRAALQTCITQAIAATPMLKPIRLRLTLNAKGQLQASTMALESVQSPVNVALYKTPVDSKNPFLQHKTTVRALYNQALAEAKVAGLFDYLFCNERGELTEGARSNLFVLLNGQWYTPPLSCGLLSGVHRSVLLQALAAQERVLSPADLLQAEQIKVCNALYGGLVASFIT
ncbi:MAG: Aminodeoxychorismate synthase component 1 [Pseudomonadota bacterium]|jgi:para-aminobenzoate synthetase/4-amino-4-deoxychorismate lyase